jgi:hypothetical protein
LNGATIHAAVMYAAAKDTIIPEECARSIAVNWMAPGTAFSAFAHHFPVSVIEFWIDVSSELNENPTAHDLSALLAFIENVTMQAERE